MATPSTREENGSMILSIYSEFERRPGEVLRSNNFVGWAARRKIRMNDIVQGLEFAIQSGWIKETSNGSLALTEEGFERI